MTEDRQLLEIGTQVRKGTAHDAHGLWTHEVFQVLQSEAKSVLDREDGRAKRKVADLALQLGEATHLGWLC